METITKFSDLIKYKIIAKCNTPYAHLSKPHTGILLASNTTQNRKRKISPPKNKNDANDDFDDIYLTPKKKKKIAMKSESEDSDEFLSLD